MAYAPTSPVTGAAQTGFTSPTYTLTADQAPDTNGKQYAISALGGTQSGVVVSSVSVPFTVNFVRPKQFKSPGTPNPVNGKLGPVGRNVWKVIVRHGLIPLAGQASQPGLLTLTAELPAGSDTADAPNIRAMLSLMIGVLNQQSAGIGDTFISGTV